MKKVILLLLAAILMSYPAFSEKRARPLQVHQEGSLDMSAERQHIDRYKADFSYNGIDYQILTENPPTVAVAQVFDIDSPGMSPAQQKAPYHRYGIGPNGFLMSGGLSGPCVAIPQTVYDGTGKPYAVTDLADRAINWVGIGILALPPSLKALNGGISCVFGLSDLYLPEGLREIDGIISCGSLRNIHIPWNVEVIRQNSLRACGLNSLYLPPSVKFLEDGVAAECESLEVVMLSEIESMGRECFAECTSLVWANLPETLTSMEEGCFNGCPGLETVSLPWSGIKMNGCFNNCPNISRIEVLASEPNPFPEDSFLDVDRATCTLAVPEGSEGRYRAAEGWKEFIDIIGDIPSTAGSGKAATYLPDFRAFGGKGVLNIINPTGQTVEVFGMNGEKVASVSRAGATCLTLPGGVYVAASPSGSYRTAVR